MVASRLMKPLPFEGGFEAVTRLLRRVGAPRERRCSDLERAKARVARPTPSPSRLREGSR